jgi:hypothetical protein
VETAHPSSLIETFKGHILFGFLCGRRITRLVIFGIEIASTFPAIGFYFSSLWFTAKPKSVDFLM